MSPILLSKVFGMIEREFIRKLVEENYLAEGIFIVDIKINKGNEIVVHVDKEDGINIEDCIKISRTIESNLDREKEDFQLDVSSPGLTEPFKVKQQYKKNIGEKIEILKVDGIKTKGKLLSILESQIEIEEKKKIKITGKKKKEIVTNNILIDLDQIKSAKVIIDFKKS